MSDGLLSDPLKLTVSTIVQQPVLSFLPMACIGGDPTHLVEAMKTLHKFRGFEPHVPDIDEVWVCQLVKASRTLKETYCV